jgi:hypothetical protein
MSAPLVTTIDAKVQPEREQELLSGFRRINVRDKPAVLVRSELLRGQDGAWRIQTTRRDMDALMALRNSGEPPAALSYSGAEHSHAVFKVEQSYDG